MPTHRFILPCRAPIEPLFSVLICSTQAFVFRYSTCTCSMSAFEGLSFLFVFSDITKSMRNLAKLSGPFLRTIGPLGSQFLCGQPTNHSETLIIIGIFGLMRVAHSSRHENTQRQMKNTQYSYKHFQGRCSKIQISPTYLFIGVAWISNN